MERFFKPLKPKTVTSPSLPPSSSSNAGSCSTANKRTSSGAVFAAAKRQRSDQSDDTAAAAAAAAASPRKVVTWNCNGLTSRLSSSSDLAGFVGFVQREAPDVVFLQETRMPAAAPPGAKPGDGQQRNRAKVHIGQGKKGREDNELVVKTFSGFSAPLAGYRPYWSLADKKYAGSGALVSRKLKPLSVRYSLLDEGSECKQHDAEGRIILLEFADYLLLATYSPNNGVVEEYFQRRRDWDAKITAFVAGTHAAAAEGRGKPLIYVGDLNCAATDSDLSHPAFFRQIVMDRNANGPPLAAENRGQPGCTTGERLRFAAMLEAGALVDVYRQQTPTTGPAGAALPASAAAGPLFSWRGTPGRDIPEAGRYYGKGMRIDHLLVSELLLQPRDGQSAWRVKRAAIHGHGFMREGFFGSDHCPMVLELERTPTPTQK